jgi:peptidyl-prolyl cis-trans isomerase D
MLQDMRDNSKGIISFILIGLLVVIFALSGVDALFQWNAKEKSVIEVNGEPITESEIERAIENHKQQMLNLYGDKVPPDYFSNENLRKPIVDSLVQNLLMSQAAKNAGLVASDKLVSARIAEISQFKDEKGQFDNKRYQQALRTNGHTHSTFSKLLSSELIANQLQSGISNTAFVTPLQIDDVVSLSFQSRDFSYAILPVAKLRETVVPSAEEIQSYYDANSKQFTTEEQVALDYISLSVTDLMKNITVTEEQLRKQYEQNLASFVATPERQAAHILIDDNDEAKIKTVTERLAKGDDFAAVARELSSDQGSKEAGGDLGFTRGDSFPAEFEAALAKLKVGEVSPAVKTDAGTHFIKLVSEKNSQAPTFEEQKLSIEEQLKRAEAETLFVSQLEKLRDASYNAETLMDAAKELSLTVQNSGLFERNKGKDLFTNPKIITAAFSPEVLNEGNTSEVIELDATSAVVMKKTDHKPSQVRPLDEVKEQILTALKDQKAQTLLKAQGAIMIAELKSGADFAELAKKAGVEVKQAKAATRNSTDVGFEISQHAFSMSRPAAGSATYSDVMAGNDLAIIALHGVTAGSYDKVTSEQKNAITAQLTNVYGRNDFSSYQEFLKDAADIDNR